MTAPTLVPPEPPTYTEFEARVAAAKYGDLRAYAKAVHSMDLEEYQDAWEEALSTYNMTIIVCPPETFKSSTVRLWVEREIGRNPSIRVLWLQNAGAQAKKWVMAIQQTIQSNSVYREAFGVEEDTEKQWTKEIIYVRRFYTGPEPTLMGCGLQGPYQGSHFDIIILDDLTNQWDVRSPTEMEAQETTVRGVVIDRLVEGGRIVGLCTRWGDNDLVPVYVDMGFTVIEMPVVGDYPWGPTLSPKRFPMERIEVLQRQKGDALFALTFMCNTQAVAGYIIKREHIGYWDNSMIPSRPLNIFMYIDPAASTKTRADCSAIATVGADYKSKVMYLLDMWAKRVETPDLEFEIARRSKRIAGLRAVGVETVGFQLSLMQSLRRKYKLPLREVPYRSRRDVAQRRVGLDRDKGSRAMYLDSLFSSGRLLIPRGLPLVDGVSLESELCRYGIEDAFHDDRSDALAGACTLAESSAPPFLRKPRQLWGAY